MSDPGNDTLRLEMDTAALRQLYRGTLLDNVIPFWLGHGMDAEHGGIMTSLDRDGSLLSTHKGVWMQGRAAWMFSTLCSLVEPRGEWLSAAHSCIGFLRAHCFGPDGRMPMVVTREGDALHAQCGEAFSESFAAIANAAYARAAGDDRAAADAAAIYAVYLAHAFEPEPAKPGDDGAPPVRRFAPHMINIVTAQEIRAALGDITVRGRTCSEWIGHSIAVAVQDFLKPEHAAVMEVVGIDGEITDVGGGHTLNPGHAMEAAWFIMREGMLRGDRTLVDTGTAILDWMWERGWDTQFGGVFSFRDLSGGPTADTRHEMKCWWPHNEAEIATLLAWRLTGEPKYAHWHRLVHDWSFAHFADPQFGEWYAHLHRDGSVVSHAKGLLFKGPFHLPRMLLVCAGLCEEAMG